MAIVKMKKLRLYGAATEQAQLIRQLQLFGSVEIGEPEQLTDAAGTPVFRAADGGSADALHKTSAQLSAALEALKPYEAKTGFLTPRPEKTLGELFDDGAYDAALASAGKVIETLDARSRNQAEKSRLIAAKESFLPWTTLELPLQTTETRHAVILTGTVSAQLDFDTLAAKVYEAADEVQLEKISADTQSLYLLVIVHKQAGSLSARYSSVCKELTDSTQKAVTTISESSKQEFSALAQEAKKKIRLCAWISITAVILCATLCALAVLWSR